MDITITKPIHKLHTVVLEQLLRDLDWEENEAQVEAIQDELQVRRDWASDPANIAEQQEREDRCAGLEDSMYNHTNYRLNQ